MARQEGESISDWRERRDAAGDELNEKLSVALDTLPGGVVKEIARQLLAEVNYLGDHMPFTRKTDVPRWTCSGNSYHVPPCGNFGIKGSCEPLPQEVWCEVAGFGCDTCELVDRLLAILVEPKCEVAIPGVGRCDVAGDHELDGVGRQIHRHGPVTWNGMLL